jgi:cupin superfamily acireductone dioxygenase involved in methionine salvage
MNAFEKAWRLLKEELTPEQEQKLEEMATSGAGFAVEEMRNTFLEQNRIAQQQQPQMTPEMQSKYQDPLDAIKQKKEQEMRIRAAMKGSRLNNPRVKQMLEEFYNQHGHYPRHTPKSLRRK